MSLSLTAWIAKLVIGPRPSAISDEDRLMTLSAMILLDSDHLFLESTASP